MLEINSPTINPTQSVGRNKTRITAPGITLGVFSLSNNPINNTVMTISIKEDNLTVAVELEENDFDKSVSCEEAMIAALDVLSRIFPEESVTRAYYRIDPDRLNYRKEDDPVRIMYERILNIGEW